MFHYFNIRLPLTNGLLIVSNSETPEGTEKINLKLLYEMFKDTKSHGLVYIQFFVHLEYFLGFIFLYQNMLSLNCTRTFRMKTLSGGRDLEFEAVSDLIGEMSFKIKTQTLSNIKRKAEQDKESNLDIKKSHDFFEEPEKFKEELEKDLYKDLEHKNIGELYVEPQVRDVETVEKET